MTNARRLAVLFAAAIPLALAGCGGADSCPTEVAKVSAAPASCTLAASSTVTVTLPLCTKCNQSVPQCVVVPPISSGDRAFQLDTTAQACIDPNSCPPGESCSLPAPFVTCTFQAPGLSANNTYDFVIIDPVGALVTVPFTVAAGGADSCSG